MNQQKLHSEIVREIDNCLLRDDWGGIASAAFDAHGKYQDWYASFLTATALLAYGENVVFAYASQGPEEPDRRVVVFTTNLVLVADIDTEADGVPVVRVARRRSLVSFKLSASERIDARDGRSNEWPGTINLVLVFRDLDKPIEVIGNGANLYAVDKPSSLVSLVRGLSADLATAP